MLRPMATQTPPDDETFSTLDIAEDAAHELAELAVELADHARKLPVDHPQKLDYVQTAAQALAAAAPFVERPRPKLRAVAA